MSEKFRRIFVFVIVLIGLSGSAAFGQFSELFPITNSPYSRLGVGDFVPQYFGAQAGMGGISAAFQDPENLNFINPASLASLGVTSLDIGLYAKFSAFSDNNSNSADNQWSGNINHLALGFQLFNPINQSVDKKVLPYSWGMGLTLQPYTNVGYYVEVNFTSRFTQFISF